MIRIVNTRLIIEKPSTHAKYYPKVISASTQQSYPFSVSGADIRVVANNQMGTSGYAAPITFDDIVRLQVSIRYHRNDSVVWQDIFHGRVQDLSSSYGTSNQLDLYCVGHEAELNTDLIEEEKSYTASTDAKTLLSYYSKYFTRLTYSDTLTDTGVLFPTYDTTANQTCISDLISDAEKNAGYDWAFKVIPTYANGNLSTIYTQWKLFSTSLVSSYKVIEGTHRLISADFDVEGEGVRTLQRIYGETPSGGTQYTGYAEDTSLSSLYGKRSEVNTYTWIKSNSLCTSVATGLLSGSKQPVTSGQVKLIGTPEASICDYVYVKIPSEEINGVSIEGNYYVKRVQHSIEGNQFETTLDLGKLKITAEDKIAKISTTVKTCKKNQVT